MNKSTFYKLRNLILLLTAMLFAGCNIDGLDTDSSELTEEELEIATQIIGESLSDQNDGIFSSLNDAFVIPSEGGLGQQFSKAGEQTFLLPSMTTGYNTEIRNANENDFSYSYDPETGIHSVSSSSSINRPSFTKESSANLEYIFYDINGEFIDTPRMDNERIETVDYGANRSGSITTPRKTSAYQRSDLFVTDGLSANSGTIQIDGLHQGSGQFEATRNNGDNVTRDYDLSVDFLNVQIDKQLMERTNSLQRGVTGSVAYEMTISRAINGDESTKTVNGTIELNGDGTALLRFRNVLDIFRIKLDDGTVFEDDEFEGFVRSLDAENQSFILFSGQTVFISDQTNIEYEDGLTSLLDVEHSLQNELRVKTDGAGAERDDGRFVATKLEFEIEDDDLEFEGRVEFVNLTQQSFTLRSGFTLFLNQRSVIDSDGDLISLQEVEEALTNGLNVEAEGEFIPESDDRLVVIEVEFEIEDDDNEGNNFEDIITAVNTDDGSFTLSTGITYFLTDDSKIDKDGDLFSTNHIRIALNNGIRIEAKGKFDSDQENNRVITSVEFEIEGDDDDYEFEGQVIRIDVSESVFELENGETFIFDDQTFVDSEGLPPEDVEQALEDNREVEAEGLSLPQSDGTRLVTKVEFELDD